MALLLYDRQAGQGEVYALDSQAHLSLLQSYSGWRNGLTDIISLGGCSSRTLLRCFSTSARAEQHSLT